MTPPGVTAEQFDAALEEFREAIGGDWVFTEKEATDLYRDAYSPLQNEAAEIVAAAALAPSTTEEVQAVVRIANRYQIPLYPISTGKNLGYGGSAPVVSGSVVLDLKRMNRVLEVNEENAYALVEPGVSYFDLYRHLQDNGYKLWIDCPDPGWGSLIGNALDHGAGYTVNPYRDHFDAHCGMEVVLPTGDVIRTGMGALPGAETWQQFRYGYGPFVDGMFSQSNFGIVTKMGFWLYPEPEAYLTGTVHVKNHDDIHELVRQTAYLMNAGVMNSSTNMQSPILAMAWEDDHLQELFLKRDQASIDELNKFAHDKGIPFWSSYLQFYGPEEVVKAQWEYAKKQFAHIDGVEFEDGLFMRFPLSEEEIEEVDDKPAIGVPSLSIFWIGARSPRTPSPTHGHFSFSPVIPMTGESVIHAQIEIMKVFKEMGTKPIVLVFPQSYHPRGFVILTLMPIHTDPETNKQYRETFRRLIKVAGDNGWGEYRTHTAFMDECAAVYSFNDHALMRFHETIKDAIDPNGILSAGRYGIWPKQERERQGRE